MSVDLELKQFTGPLDLLLTLIDDEKLPINELALSHVTEQYITYVDSLNEVKADELADFLVVATRLLLLKSKKLLPQFLPEEDEGQSLEDQLRRYRAFVAASKELNTKWVQPSKTSFRFEPPRKSTEFVPPVNATLESMHKHMVQLINRLKPAKPLPQTQIDKNITLKHTIDRLRSLLNKKKSVSFLDALEDSQNKTEVIVGFLALLELVKQKTVRLTQQEQFGDIMIIKQ